MKCFPILSLLFVYTTAVTAQGLLGDAVEGLNSLSLSGNILPTVGVIQADDEAEQLQDPAGETRSLDGVTDAGTASATPIEEDEQNPDEIGQTENLAEATTSSVNEGVGEGDQSETLDTTSASTTQTPDESEETTSEPSETPDEPTSPVSLSTTAIEITQEEDKTSTSAESTSSPSPASSILQTSVSVPASPSSKGPRRTDKEPSVIQDPTAIFTQTGAIISSTSSTKAHDEEGFQFTWPYIVGTCVAGVIVLGVIIASAIIQYKRKKQAKIWGEKEFDGYPPVLLDDEEDRKSEVGSAR